MSDAPNSTISEIKSVKKPVKSKRKRTLKQKLGQKGELQALNYLKKNNYFILDKNYRHSRQEIDIIAQDHSTDEIVFVEVKYRSSFRYGNPCQAVNNLKISSITQAATAYIKDKKLTNDFRIDVIAIVRDQINHYKNITWFY